MSVRCFRLASRGADPHPHCRLLEGFRAAGSLSLPHADENRGIPRGNSCKPRWARPLRGSPRQWISTRQFDLFEHRLPIEPLGLLPSPRAPPCAWDKPAVARQPTTVPAAVAASEPEPDLASQSTLLQRAEPHRHRPDDRSDRPDGNDRATLDRGGSGQSGSRTCSCNGACATAAVGACSDHAARRGTRASSGDSSPRCGASACSSTRARAAERLRRRQARRFEEDRPA